MKSDSHHKKHYCFSDLGFEYDPDIMFCASCGLRMLYPLLTNERYAYIYSSEYFSSTEDDFYDQSRADRLRVYECKCNKMKQYAPNAHFVLDIGAGEGDFLNICRNSYAICGLEPSEHGVNAAREKYNIEMLKGSASDVVVLKKKFDIIHMHHVFEHLIDPVQFLKDLKKVMHPGSIFIFEIPYQFGSLQDMVRSLVGFPVKRKGLYAIHHPYFYTPKSIWMLLNNNGFQVLNLTTCPPERKLVLYDGFMKRSIRRLFYLLQKISRRGPVIETVCRLDVSDLSSNLEQIAAKSY